jgi:F-type H+-transporting ATPase subunit delta
MSVTTIANRYARALADVTDARGETDVVAAEVQWFARLVEQHKELHDVFASPVVPLERKRAVLNEILARLGPQQTTTNFLQLLLTNKRLHDLGAVRQSLARVLDERRGVVAAEVTTARDLGEQERQMLADRLRAATGKQVRLSFHTDPEIIGGVVTRIGSLVYDGSIKTQLAEMRQQLIRG